MNDVELVYCATCRTRRSISECLRADCPNTPAEDDTERIAAIVRSEINRAARASYD